MQNNKHESNVYIKIKENLDEYYKQQREEYYYKKKKKKDEKKEIRDRHNFILS